MPGSVRAMGGFGVSPDRDGRPWSSRLRVIFSGALFAATLLGGPIAPAIAQEDDTVFDEAGVLTNAEEVEVQQALDEASASTEEPHYLFFVGGEDVPAEVPTGEDRQDLLRAQAEDAGAPDEAGVIVVAPENSWAVVSPEVEDAQGVYEAMRPEFQDRSYAEAAITGAERIADDATIVPEVAGFGAGAALLVAVVGGALLARRRLRRRRELARSRGLAEDEFGRLRERMADYNEKERLVAGYLEAQRGLISPGAEAEAEKHLGDAGGARFGEQFTEASRLFASDPHEALARIRRGNDLLDGALESLDRAEETLDRHRKTLPESRRDE
jgi:hypothetical protein